VIVLIQAANRIEKLPRYLFAEIDKQVREAQKRGVDVIKLGIGDPDTPTPDYIIDRMAQEIRRPENHRYPPDYGLPEFKQAVADYYLQRYGVTLDPEKEVVPLIGSKEGIANISYCFVNPGDINLVPDPGYPVYSIGTMFAGGESYFLPLRRENGFLPELDAVPEDVARRAKLLFLNYPNNPTGAVAVEGFWEQVVDFARRYDILVCHDVAYSEITYDGYRPTSFLEAAGAKEVGIEFNSLSKPFNMTGWRVGYAVGNAEALEVLSRYKTNVDSGLFQAIQYTGVEAFTNPKREEFLETMKNLYQERRDVVVEGLKNLGWEVDVPKATFYIWAPLPDGYTDSRQFISNILNKTGVVLTPGIGFGKFGEGYYRIALTVGKERLREALERIRQAVE